MISLNYLGDINKNACAKSYTYRDKNEEVYIPLFKTSTFKKSFGKPYLHVREENPQDIIIFPYKINDINILK